MPTVAPKRLPTILEDARLGATPRAANSTRNARRTRRRRESRRRRRYLPHLAHIPPLSSSKLRAACGATQRNSHRQQMYRWAAIRLGLCPGIANNYVPTSLNTDNE
jgi:hypothetical protein